MIGQTLSHFEITAKLGEGGMGEVYRATDTELGREVAIKVLPEAVARDPERLARFEREARVLAALDHSNIAAIYGLEEAEGRKVLVLQLAAGETLAERIERGPIPVDEALPIALQIAEALEAAHDRGIIHRDLKPANVKVTPGGQVKVLDFGLAKALGPELSADGEQHLTRSPTLTAQMTGEGIILGSAAYMSPEQARGREADQRADLWALGVVLWEMLTWKRLFEGETVTDSLAHVLGREPDWTALPDSVPPSAVRLLRRTLVKDAHERLNHAGDARLELEEALRELRRPREEVFGTRSRADRVALWIAGVAGAILATTALIVLTSQKPLPSPTVLPLALGSEPVAMRLGASAVLSPDGRRIAWLQAEPAGAETLWIRDLGGAEARQLPGTEGAHNPFFSPDGREIAFFARGSLRKVALDGSSPMALAEVGDPRGGTWTDDGFIVFNRDVRDGLWRVPASGGDAERLTQPDRDKNERSHRWPDAAPGSRTLLFLAQDLGQEYEKASIEALELQTGERTLLHRGGSYPRLTASGQLLFVRDRALWAAPIDLDPPRLTGEPKRVLDRVTYARWSGGAQFDVSESGELLYSVGENPDTSIVVQRAAGGAPLRRVLVEPGYYGDLRLSPDGSRLALHIYTGTRTDVWVLDLEQGTPNRFTFGGRDASPVWSPDGRELAFEAMTDRSVPNVFARRADGAGRLRALTESTNQQGPTSWSPDGILLYDEIRPQTGHDIFALDTTRGGARPEPFAATSARERDGQFSPDGRWIAYVSDELGTNEVFVQPYPGPGGRWQISQGQASHPRWSRDGTRLYYWSGRSLTEREVLVEGTAPGGRHLELGESRTVLEFDEAELRELDFDVAPDGGLFLLERAEGSGRPQETVLVLDWVANLQARLERDR